tara:strand:- start:88 stop:426 length:339 start_codon:yes stop_codon:yes gene_type:complete
MLSGFLFCNLCLALYVPDLSHYIEATPSPSPVPNYVENTVTKNESVHYEYDVYYAERTLAAQILFKDDFPSTAAITQLSDKKVARILTRYRYKIVNTIIRKLQIFPQIFFNS